MMKNKVLVVDDDKDLCVLLERELKSEDFDVTVCNNGGAGLDVFKW